MVSDFYAPVTGGVEQFVETLGRCLVQRGHSVAVATLKTGGCTEREERDGVRIYRLRATPQRFGSLFSDDSRRFSPPWPDPEAALGLRQVLACERPDVVHGHNWLTYSILPPLLASTAKLVISLHDYAYVCPKKNLVFADGGACTGPRLGKCLRCAGQHYGPVKGTPTVLGSRLMQPALLRKADACIAVSSSVAERSQLRERATIIPPFIADDIETHADGTIACVGELPNEPFILFVGQLGRHKGLHTLLEAYEGLTDAPPLVLIGSRREDTPTSVPANVRMLHDWPHSAVLEAWRRSLFGVVPSLWAEPFGIVSLEAMAFGHPLVASRTGGIVDCIEHGENGLLVPPGDVGALRTAIRCLVDDAHLRARMGRAAHERSFAYRAARIVPRIEAVYQGVLTHDQGI